MMHYNDVVTKELVRTEPRTDIVRERIGTCRGVTETVNIQLSGMQSRPSQSELLTILYGEGIKAVVSFMHA